MFVIALFRPEGAPALPMSVLALPFVGLAISHLISCRLHYIGLGEYRTATPGQLMTVPYARVFALHITILAGGFLVVVLGEPEFALLVLVAAKIGVDIIIHRWEHRRKLRRLEAERRRAMGERDPDFPGWDAEEESSGSSNESELSRVAAPDSDQILEELQPQVRQLEQDHERYRKRGWIELASLVVLAMVITVVAMWGLEAPIEAGAFFGLLITFIAALVRRETIKKKWKQHALDVLAPKICSALGEVDYASTPDDDQFLKPFENLEVVGKANKKELGPYFHGRCGNTRFELAKAHLTRESGGKNSSTETIFSGRLFRIQLPF